MKNNCKKTTKKYSADPRVKILLIVLLTTLAVLAKDIMYLGIVVILSIIADCCFKADIISLFKRLKHFFWLVIFISIVQSLSIKGGESLIYIKDVVLLSTRGIQFAVEFIFRMSIIVFAGGIATTSEGQEFMDGLLKMRLPYEFVFMATIALRYLPLFREEFTSRLNAIYIRGINIKKLKFSKKLKIYGAIIAPTVAGSVLKSQELSKSIEARGFRAMKKRTMLRYIKFNLCDYVICLFAILSFLVYLGLMYSYGQIVIL